ncbi:MAG: transposase [Saccharospirillaceae bacterium]|nr:transposase [Pseudomonadales bacterium]NRB80075.1 transposase [Saccharospirillaceae bacterium]
MSFNELRNGRVSITHQEYLITFVTKNRKRIFTDLQTCSTAINEILDLKEGVWLAWVLMPDHFHGLIRLGSLTLAQEIGRCKSKSAIKVNQHLKSQGELWQTSFYDRALRDESEQLKVARYIVANPLRAKLVGEITDYPYWNSSWL